MATKTQSTVPDTWPGAFGVYKFSKAAVKPNVWTLVILQVLNLVISGGLQLTSENSEGSAGLDLVSLIVGSLITAALTYASIASVREQKVSLGEAFNKAFPMWLKMIGLTILIGLSYFASILLLLIPFFFVFPRLILAPYLLVDKNMGIIDAYKASWQTTKGHALKVWAITLVNLAMALLMITIIGIPFAIYFLIMYMCAYAVLYEYILKHPKEAAEPAPAA